MPKSTEKQPHDEGNPFDPLLRWLERPRTRRELFRDIGAATLATGGAAALAVYLWRQATTPEIEKRFGGKTADITSILEGGLDEQTFSLERAMGENWNQNIAAKWQRAKTEKGWNDRDLCRMLVQIKAGREELGGESMKLVGRRFGFQKVYLLFDEKEDAALSTITPATTLLVNLLHDTPAEMLPDLRNYTLPHEFSHIVVSTGEDERVSKRLEHNPYVKYPEDANLDIVTQLFHERDIAHPMAEVLANTIGLQFAEAMGRRRQFVQGFSNHATRELRRYERMPPQEQSFTDISDIAGYSVFAERLGERSLAGQLDRVSRSMFPAIVDNVVRMGQIQESQRKELEAKIGRGYDQLLGMLRGMATAELRGR